MDEIQSIREYCLNCVNKPCSQKGCPLGNNIPEFIHETDEKTAFEILCKTTVLPAICGRVCPHSKQCQGSCVRGIKGESVQIGKMEAYLGDKSIENGYKIPTEIDEKLSNKKVAVIGGGPCGLTCAAFLAKKGVKVTIYEKQQKLGGLLRYGIPDFRLNREIIDKTIEKILNLGISYKTNCKLGKDIKIEELKKEYDAVFISIGANEPNITLEGENVLSGNLFLEKLNNNEESLERFKNKKVIVNGGGNCAIDVARTLKRADAKVTIVYRRSEAEMPAEKKEIAMAKKENVEFEFLTNINSFNSNEKSANCIRTRLIQKEGETRLFPVNIDGSEFTINADYVFLATGAKTDKKILDEEKIELNDRGYVKTEQNHIADNVFAGGDVIGEEETVAFAARSGRNASEKIIKYLYKN